jgi:hypothetical protein
MARGTANGEPVVSQANSDAYREGYARTLGDKKAERGRWVYDVRLRALVPADEYVPPARAVDAPIIADRIHEGTHFDDGSRVWNLGSRRKRREFKRELGVTDRSDYGPGWRERRLAEREQRTDRKTEAAFENAARKLYQQGKLR